MFHFQPKPAVVQMLDTTRGDLFAVITNDSHYIVRMEDALPDADYTVGKFVTGTVGIGEKGEPVLLRLHPSVRLHPNVFVHCTLLRCAALCHVCGGGMEVVGEVFVCTECGATL